ncbi:MAG: coat protein [Cressdnaviricota sp.]|nr:MAG: coat protein [Cressdnaviricota sp.]
MPNGFRSAGYRRTYPKRRNFLARRSTSFSLSRYGRGRYGKKRTGKFGKRTVITSYARDVETKYCDNVICALSSTYQTVAHDQTLNQAFRGQNVCWNSTDWGTVQTVGSGYTPAVKTNNLLRCINSGTTANQRIGNVIDVKYIKGTINFAANVETDDGSPQYGEHPPEAPGPPAVKTRFVRTTYRFAVVKDLQVNNSITTVKWSDVFQSTDTQGGNFVNGVNSEKNIENMGRFRILKDKYVTLDSDDPQKSVKFLIPGIGKVRYNGPNADALTDNGIHVIWSCVTKGVNDGTKISPCFPDMNCRIAYKDA